MRIAVIGAGPAGIYAAGTLAKEGLAVDVFDRLPTPYGLIRYGVAPDHPRIKEIVTALHQVLDDPRVRFIGNVGYGTDVTPAELDEFYDATIVATGADRDRELDIPGISLPGSFGAADFVSWYDGHPDAPRDWPLDAARVAVLGAGNVAVDVARILAKTADELLETDIPDNVYRRLAVSPVTDVHVFSRRGPAQVKFTPLELRELDESPNVEVIVHADAADLTGEGASRSVRMCVDTLRDWAGRERRDRPRRLHLHFHQAPAAILGTDRVTGLRTETQRVDADGRAHGTGEFTDWDVQAVYRAIGYLSRPVAGLPFDAATGTVPHTAGRINGTTRRYVTGWIKRGPVGLIGHTRKDANETVRSLLADLPSLPPVPGGDILGHLSERGIAFTTWDGWQRLDRHEIELGVPHGRRRVKVVPREELVRISRTD